VKFVGRKLRGDALGDLVDVSGEFRVVDDVIFVLGVLRFDVAEFELLLGRENVVRGGELQVWRQRAGRRRGLRWRGGVLRLGRWVLRLERKRHRQRQRGGKSKNRKCEGQGLGWFHRRL
jgi:hypothetical protein